ncbi:hypothetical protein DFS34DRAFT_623807 [Phlyctochytrium arcticum]|nr:hypothetical protein DFS34DRAFT_623807 [Phlyctochytrium arcticum]
MFRKKPGQPGATRTGDLCDLGPRFNPPLWIQRRALVSRILKEHGVKTVLDLGCGEGALLEILLNDTNFTKLAGVDIDPKVVKQAGDSCSPSDYDRQYLREIGVDLELYVGSVGDADARVMGYDAIASVEVIEHLDADVLAKFPSTTLGTYHPRVMVVSTPNGDFNVKFPDLNWGTSNAGFRHWDHRFEWTRAQFQEWATEAANQYGYNVTFDGVGTFAGEELDEFGHCSQVAIFVRDDELSQFPVSMEHTPWSHVKDISFPFFEEEFSPSEILEELQECAITLVWNVFHSMVQEAGKGRPPPVWKSKGEWILDISQFWGLLRVRQICKYVEYLKEVLALPEASERFEYNIGTNKVRLLFDIPNDALEFDDDDDLPVEASDDERDEFGNFPTYPQPDYGNNTAPELAWGDPPPPILSKEASTTSKYDFASQEPVPEPDKESGDWWCWNENSKIMADVERRALDERLFIGWSKDLEPEGSFDWSMPPPPVPKATIRELQPEEPEYLGGDSMNIPDLSSETGPEVPEIFSAPPNVVEPDYMAEDPIPEVPIPEVPVQPLSRPNVVDSGLIL